ncbi:restriction endonuclease subunit S [Lactobacillus delbrueckii subsp. bulgaricus]|nr:hypothetical protein [Lactobacillus delbrueckii subsp. bulgaricus]
MTKYKLAQLAEIKYGKDHKKLGKGSVPVYGTGGIMRYVNDFIYEGESVLIPRKGSLNNLFYVHGKFWTVDTIFWTKIDSKIVLPRYLYYYLSRIDLTSYNVGSAVPSLTISLLNELVLDIPPISVQKDVVNKLTAIENKIKINEQINDNLLELSNTLFKNMFKSDGDNLISDYLLPKRGKNLLKKNVVPGKVPVVAGGLKPAAFHNEANTKAPAITISASGANAGFVQIWGQEVWSSDSSYIDTTIAADIFFWYILLKNKQEQIFDAQSGSAQPHIYPKHIGNLTVPNFDMSKVHEFNDLITPIFNKIFQNQKENRDLEEIKIYLLNTYFN